MFATSIFTIHRQPDPTAPIEVVEPGTVYVTETAEFAEMVELGAARESTEAEIAAFESDDPDGEAEIARVAAEEAAQAELDRVAAEEAAQAELDRVAAEENEKPVKSGRKNNSDMVG